MPETSTPTPTSTTPQRTIAGLRQVLRWLEEHTDLPLARIDYASNDSVELTLDNGGYDLLTAALQAAQLLSDPEIGVAGSVPFQGQHHWCQLTVIGWAATDTENPIRVTVGGICYGNAAAALRSSLGAPAVPGEPWWDITTEHLASLLPAGA